ncbi:helix-turn-helix domain-containing protein [Vibrio sp. SCSIO 43136]|uniref:Crp/Fnr family transcriptional regulator n=1 Tax=Vibrio sp. SCSIO 43136 TaxID=2819101 RepID=UPI0020761811|nr:helix-turn-helix domain-containing protein [Vibrio sp. SCSIO 43136]USD67135.1 Crp/Fnr family transcriptional regulator [Vibrio sp. SCSIO 43136]
MIANFDIQWPCDLDKNTQQQLTDIAIPISGLSQIKHSAPPTRKGRGVFYVAKGLISVSFAADGPQSMSGGLLGEGLWLGGSLMMTQMLINANIEEVKPTELLYFPKEKIEKLAETNPFIYKWLYFSAGQVQQSWLQSQVASLHDKETRIIATLLSILDKSQSIRGAVPHINISQKQLSTITGISRPRLNEVLKKLEGENKISLARGKVYFEDLESLTKQLQPIKEILPNLDRYVEEFISKF